MYAISLIQAEHRNLGMTLLSFEKLLLDIEARQRKPDCRLFRAIVRYIDSFLYRFHHPKEDEHLFPALLRRHAPSEELIQQLQNDHEHGAAACRALSQILALCETTVTEFARFKDAALQFIHDERRHIGMEEAQLLPLAREHLTPHDWAQIDDAFSSNDDPIFGEKPTREYRDLSRIIHNVCIFNNPML